MQEYRTLKLVYPVNRINLFVLLGTIQIETYVYRYSIEVILSQQGKIYGLLSRVGQ